MGSGVSGGAGREGAVSGSAVRGSAGSDGAVNESDGATSASATSGTAWASCGH